MKFTYLELETLYEITNLIINSTDNDIEKILKEILHILSSKMNLQRGIISILDKTNNEIFHDTYGFDDPKETIRFRIGEGITGKVIESGEPIGVPRLDKAPFFLDKTGIRKNLNREELAFICVPIKYHNETIGALSVDMPSKEGEENLNKKIDFLLNVASRISEVVKRRALITENTRLKDLITNKSRDSLIIGNSKKMKELKENIFAVAKSDISVLITGETGTGKELVAKEIHNNSFRKEKPFIAVNCGALPEGVVESELFGHKKGAFTGANETRIGKFEAANEGTIFLDEIGELPFSLQVKLLRVLQEKEITRIGENKPIKVDVRIIAATNKDLEKEVAEGRFRADLYYRLNVFHIFVPPLRERGADIILLADYFVQKYTKRTGKIINRIDTPTIDMLMKYHWPGNVRELENCIERACLITTDDAIHSHNLPPSLQINTTKKEGDRIRNFEILIQNYEKELITDALKETNGNQKKAAELLGTTQRIIQYKITKYGIDYERFKLKK